MSVQAGLLQAVVLNGQGGARIVEFDQLQHLQLAQTESLWLHWDRSQNLTQRWLRQSSGLDKFACDLLLEENTRPRLLALSDEQLLVFLRGVNRNPGSEPEDMVSVRIYADKKRLISLRLRPLLATEELMAAFEQGRGPRTISELLLALTQHLTVRVEELIGEINDQLDLEEDRLDADPHYRPGQHSMLQLRRRAAGLRRFLAPQRDLFGQMPRAQQSWFSAADQSQWNELSNRMTRYLEELELLRERANLVLESETRRLTERMNRVMYRFAVVAGIFLPLTFLTGLLGINIGGVPGVDNPDAFLIACGFMLLLVVIQLLLYRYWRWL